MAGIKPTKVTFLNHGKVTGHYPLLDTHYSSLDDEDDKNGHWHGYFTHGNPEQALVVGPVNAQVAFFDDQEFRPDENSLIVSLKREGTEANPVVVDVSYPRLGSHDHPNGLYMGEEPSFGWILQKQAKASWAENTLRVAGDFITIVKLVVDKVPQATQWAVYADVAGVVVSKLQGFDTSGRSDNSQVDNISSVLFGSFDG